MDAGVFFYNFGWKDYHEASMANILDMVKVLSFALSEGKVSRGAGGCQKRSKGSEFGCKGKQHNDRVFSTTAANTLPPLFPLLTSGCLSV